MVLGATPIQMGWLGLAGSLPNLLFGLVAGVWVDRSQRRPLLIGADLGRALLLGTIPLAAWLGTVTFVHLWVVTFLAGTFTVFFQIAAIAVLPAIVSPKQLVEANSKLSLSDSVVAIAGPGLAGGLVQIVSAPKAVVVDALSYLASAVALRGVRVAEAAPVAAQKRFFHEVGEGVHELVRTPLLRLLTLTSTLGMLAGSLQSTVQMLYFVNELQFSAAVIGVMLACSGIGSLAGAAAAGWLAGRLHTGSTLVFGKLLWIMGSLLIVVAGNVVHGSVAVAAGLVLIGLGMSIYFVNQLSLRQVVTSVHLLGRVTAARRFVLFGVAALGALAGGFLGETIGLQATLLVAAAALTAELGLLLFTPLRRAQVGT
ncbi:MAG TPA: MFS transporter [Caldilineaceae bacterium]|nr:MFS transporter [Caldilineaceae bacterium]